MLSGLVHLLSLALELDHNEIVTADCVESLRLQKHSERLFQWLEHIQRTIFDSLEQQS